MTGAVVVLALVASAPAARAQTLNLPPRPASAPGGAEIAREIRELDLDAREARVYAEIARGNVPEWLRQLRPIDVTREIDRRRHRATFWVTPDYLAVGSEDDFLLVPLSPQTAQRIADLVGGSLPTPRMVDAIWSVADVRLDPAPVPPSPEMTTVRVFEDHNGIVRAQRAGHAQPGGALVAGHKKDVVLTATLAARPGKVAIYGWHRLDGRAIQPLYTGHTDRWVDYSHGIRVVNRNLVVDGTRRDLMDVLRNDTLAPILSDEGVVAEPRYPAADEPLRVDALELWRLEETWNRAHLRGDTTALAALWSDDLVVMVPGMPAMAKEELLQFWRSGRGQIGRYATSEVRMQVVGDSALVTGRLERERDFNGRVVRDDWRFTKVYRRIGGLWRVAVYRAVDAMRDLGTGGET